jgi:hypothetical protein
MSLDSSVIEINCSCGHIAKINRDEQVKIFGAHVRIVDLNYFYEQFVCNKCSAKRPKTLKKKKNLLFDPKNLKKCKVCSRYISIPRLKISDIYCSPECESITLSPEEQKKINEYKKVVEKKIKEEGAEAEKKRIIELNKFQEKKYAMVGAYKSLKQGSITKNDYEKKFKQVTWWIKEKIEEKGGYLVDNPANYISCPRCKNLTLVLWTPKYNRYFLGCSEYKNGCTWAKTIWVHGD